ncbi:MAG: hypothetical protein ACKVJF_13505, partial [Flavobacteriales bacterium]
MKKNLDHLFQEKLTDLHELPNENVWKSIEASLDKNKKSRRILPLWWTLGGVAALLAILYVVQPNATDLNTNTIITDTEQKNLATPDVDDENQNRVLENNEDALTTIERPEEIHNNSKKGNIETQQQENSWATSSSQQQSSLKSNGTVATNLVNPAKNNIKKEGIASLNPKDPSNTLGQVKKGNMVAEINENQKNNMTIADDLDIDAKKKTFDSNSLSSEDTKIANQELNETEISITKKS